MTTSLTSSLLLKIEVQKSVKSVMNTLGGKTTVTGSSSRSQRFTRYVHCVSKRMDHMSSFQAHRITSQYARSNRNVSKIHAKHPISPEIAELKQLKLSLTPDFPSMVCLTAEFPLETPRDPQQFRRQGAAVAWRTRTPTSGHFRRSPSREMLSTSRARGEARL